MAPRDTREQSASNTAPTGSTGMVSPPPKAPAKAKRSRRGGFHRKAGARDMKEYPLTLQEMLQLGAVGLAATLMFALAGFFLSTWFDIYKDLALAADLPPETRGYWRGLKAGAWWGWIVSAIVGVALLCANGWTLVSIINSTEHPNDQRAD
jgi:hypothetical protein